MGFKGKWFYFFMIAPFLLILTGCGGSSSTTTPPVSSSQWTWISGSNTGNAKGVYGTLNIAASTNVPGARDSATSWIDSAGNLWLFGGAGYDSAGLSGWLNDLWKFDGTNWTWVSGSNLKNQSGVYGTQYISALANVPGGRYGALSWIDGSNNLWLFGGYGCDSAGCASNPSDLNDLWMYNVTTGQWTWMAGSNAVNQVGNSGTKGVATGSNIPGARRHGISWTDSIGNFWLFGGFGYDSAGNVGSLNDLWKYVPSTKLWTWISGSNLRNAYGNYGTKGVAASTNVPGSRENSISWIDKSNNLWLFGGVGYLIGTTFGELNDLWKFDGTNWIWVSGSNSINQSSIYGTLGVASSANAPGGRDASISWTDSSGNFWLFGGTDLTSFYNDFWKFDGVNWTWVSGSSTANGSGSYGSLGIASTANLAGARSNSVPWIDKSNNLWLFGGLYAPSGAATSQFNDLWRIKP